MANQWDTHFQIDRLLFVAERQKMGSSSAHCELTPPHVTGTGFEAAHYWLSTRLA